MTILIISNFFKPNVGGVETHLDDLCSYLVASSNKVYVLTNQPLTTNAKGKKIEKEGLLEIYRFQWYGRNLFHTLEKYPLMQFFYLTPALLFHAIFFCVKKNKEIDAIHGHGLIGAFICSVLRWLFKKRTIVSMHAIYNFGYKPRVSFFVKRIFLKLDKILSLSKQSEKELQAIGIPKEKITIFTYWVDQELFKPLDKIKCKTQVGWNDKFVVLFVGRFIQIKGMELLLEAAKIINKKISFALIGDGPMAETLQNLCKKIPNAIFVGKIDNEKLPVYYNAADILAVPSQYEEGFARVILEASSCGLPIVGSRRGGIVEAVDENMGILVEPTVEEFKNALEFLYNNSNKLNSLQKTSFESAKNRFSSKNAEVILNSYKT